MPIDLHSQHPNIIQQDFFDRPIPANDDEKFDIVSCSLVLNFVPEPRDRGKLLRPITPLLISGAMLKLIHGHLRPQHSSRLFLVLPLPCVRNSRYFDQKTLIDIMRAIGFELIQERWKDGGKVGYWLWGWRERGLIEERYQRKRVINEGSKRNNFSILL